MKKLNILLIAGLFIFTSQTLNAQIKVSGALKKAKSEIEKSNKEKEEKEKAEKEKEEQNKAKIEQEEKEKAKKEEEKDYPLVSRFEGSEMKYYKETKWGAYKLPVNDKGALDWDNPKVLEGKVIRIQYSTSIDNNSEYVLQNYKAAFKKAGFSILIAIANEELGVSDRPHTWKDKYYVAGGYYNGLNNEKFGIGINFPIWKNNHSFIAAHGNKDGKDIYAIIYTVVDDNYTLLTQDIIEVEAVETGMVSAENIAKGIQTDGHIAIYDILFETGKSDIKPESEAAIKNVADYMNANTDKKFNIVGHTDNVGDFNANMILSESRAKAILNTLVTKYTVKAEQLKAYGVSSLSPVATNTTEEGKAKNRRVDIVEQ
jgi:OmpA-OmpF porin, OOP family